LGALFRGKPSAPARDADDDDEREGKPVHAPAPRPPTLLHEAITGNDLAVALRILRDGRDGADEGELVEAALAALGPPREADDGSIVIAAATPEDRSRDDLLLLLAEILVARGARKKACEVLGRARSPSALVLRADLLVEGVEGVPLRDDLDRALALLSRALVLDIDAPGARDRWERLRNRLGHAEEARGPSIGVTLVAKGASIPFVLLREVARGGAGVVYEARERLGEELTRTVALKMAHTDRTRDGREARAQLAHEARVAVQFRGPGVVPILDLDIDQGWLAMAWAGGTSLRARLREARPGDPLAGSRRWLELLVKALADVHAAAWVHGDVKPANVLFDARDRPWFGDFGLARRCGEPNTAGSAGYVAPERTGGAACSPHDDVYGLGKLMHDVLAAGWCQADAQQLRAVADACVAPIDARPRDARAVLSLLSET
ncbi:MAG: protein kinase, partial [Polyangiales bacterium]